MPQRIQPQCETETEEGNTMKNHAELNFRMKNYYTCIFFIIAQPALDTVYLQFCPVAWKCQNFLAKAQQHNKH